MPKITVTCEGCGKPFEGLDHRLHRSVHHFCSRACCFSSLKRRRLAKQRPLAERFWSKVNKSSGHFALINGQLSECWEWTGCRTAKGYGDVRVRGRNHKAQRIAYFLTYGDFDQSKMVCHKCDNPPCCRGEHLFLETPAGNTRDMMIKGRGRHGARPTGSKHPNAKLNEAQVVEIRQLYASGLFRQHEIASRFGIASKGVSQIVRRRIWKHIP